jgi:hypothetical protein
VSYIKKVRWNNFSLWKFHSRYKIQSRIGLITDFNNIHHQKRDNPENEKDIFEWKQRDCRARVYIISTINLKQQLLLIDCTTANQMWSTLSVQYLEQAPVNLHDLQAQWYQYKYKKGTDMYTIIAYIKAIAHLHIPILLHYRKKGRTIDQTDLVIKIMSELPEEYRLFVSSSSDRSCWCSYLFLGNFEVGTKDRGQSGIRNSWKTIDINHRELRDPISHSTPSETVEPKQ